MNGFTKKRVGTMTLGEKLRKIRTDRRMSLNEVSRCTKVQVKYLEKIEEGKYEELPADVYVKGFLRSYGEFLCIDSDVLVRLYEKERGIKKNLAKGAGKEEDLPKPINISSFVFTPRKLAIASISVLAMLVLLFIYREIGSFASTPRLILLNPQNNAEVETNNVLVEGITEKDAKIFINDQPILVNDEGKFREAITLQVGANAITVRSVNKFNKEESVSVNVKSNFQETQFSEEENNEGNLTEEMESDQELNLEIRVDPGPVWLSVESDGNLVFSGTMLNGASQSFKAKEKIIVSSGHANATFLKFNGKDIGQLGEDEGAVRGVVFDKNTKK